MANSTAKRAPSKPAKPYPDFPLFAHASRRWCKKIRGKHVYFGPWGDPDAALQKYLDQRDDLHAGRRPRINGDGLTVVDLVNRYLSAKKLLVDSGEIRELTWIDNRKACGRVIECFGRDRLVDDLRPEDFERLRGVLSRTMGLRTIKTEMQRVRSLFRYAFDAGLTDKTVRFGPTFKNPSKMALDKLRLANGSKMFEAHEIRALLEAAGDRLRAMVYLGINAGFGNFDCASLPLVAVDLDHGWINHPRPKTAISRRCPLWKETVEAVTIAIDGRPAARDPADENLVFLTHFGRPYIRTTDNGYQDNMGCVFRELLAKLGLQQKGRGFYALRHSHRTISDEVRDQPAADHIMGHSDQTMAGHYRERIDDERLRAVTDHVHKWLLGE